MLGASIAPDPRLLARSLRGLLAYVDAIRIDGVASSADQLAPIAMVPVADNLTMSLLVQRPYLMSAGTMTEGFPPGDVWQNYWHTHIDNGALNSKFWIDSGIGAALANMENTLVPVKSVTHPDGMTGYAPGVVLTVPTYTSPPGTLYRANLYTQKPGALAGGANRYDCYFQSVNVCRNNFFRIRNLDPGSSVRLSVNGAAAVTYNVDGGGRIAHDFAAVAFPASVMVELWTGINATGRKYGVERIRRAYGGDEYRGTGPTLAPVVIVPLRAKNLWVATAAREAGSSVNPPKSIDGDFSSSRYQNGATVNPAIDYLKIDTGAAATIGTLVINNTAAPQDIPQTGDVFTSLDNIAWTLRGSWAAPNIAAGMLTVAWAPILARYVRINPSSTPVVAGNWWSVYELYLS